MGFENVFFKIVLILAFLVFALAACTKNRQAAQMTDDEIALKQVEFINGLRQADGSYAYSKSCDGTLNMGTNKAGNQIWAMVAHLSAYDITKDSKYLDRFKEDNAVLKKIIEVKPALIYLHLAEVEKIVRLMKKTGIDESLNEEYESLISLFQKGYEIPERFYFHKGSKITAMTAPGSENEPALAPTANKEEQQMFTNVISSLNVLLSLAATHANTKNENTEHNAVWTVKLTELGIAQRDQPDFMDGRACYVAMAYSYLYEKENDDTYKEKISGILDKDNFDTSLTYDPDILPIERYLCVDSLVKRGDMLRASAIDEEDSRLNDGCFKDIPITTLNDVAYANIESISYSIYIKSMVSSHE